MATSSSWSAATTCDSRLELHDDARCDARSVDAHERYDSFWVVFMTDIKAAGRGGAYSSPRRGGHRLYVDAVVGAAAQVLPATVLGATRRYDRALWLQVGGTTQWGSTDGEEPAAAVLVERGATEIAVASARAAGLHPGFALTAGSAVVRQLVAPTTAVQAMGACPMHGHGLCRASAHWAELYMAHLQFAQLILGRRPDGPYPKNHLFG